jgi:DNA excision repair protein ERCC-5
MGVKGLWRLLLPIGRRISIETLEGKVLAIDASIWLTQFIKAMRDPDTGNVKASAHVIGFFRRLAKLRFHGIRPVLVFDGATPTIKLRELEQRRRRREQFAANSDGAVQRLAKRLLFQELKRVRLLKDTVEEDSRQAEGLNLAEIDNDEDVTYIDSRPKHTKASEEEQSIEETSQKIALILQEDEWQATSNLPLSQQQLTFETSEDIARALQEEEWEDVYDNNKDRPNTTNDWDLHITDDTSHDSSKRIRKKSKIIKKNNHDFDVEYLISLPAQARKEMLEDAIRNQRIESRREFMPVAAKPDEYSQVQIRNFLRQTQLNKKIVQISQETSKCLNCDNDRIASEPTSRVIFEKYSEKQSSDQEKIDSQRESESEVEWEDVSINDEEFPSRVKQPKDKMAILDSSDDESQISGKQVVTIVPHEAKTLVIALSDDDSSEGGFLKDKSELTPCLDDKTYMHSIACQESKELDGPIKEEIDYLDKSEKADEREKEHSSIPVQIFPKEQSPKVQVELPFDNKELDDDSNLEWEDGDEAQLSEDDVSYCEQSDVNLQTLSNVAVSLNDFEKDRKENSDIDNRNALHEAQSTASSLTDWAGRVFRRAIAEHERDKSSQNLSSEPSSQSKELDIVCDKTVIQPSNCERKSVSSQEFGDVINNFDERSERNRVYSPINSIPTTNVQYADNNRNEAPDHLALLQNEISSEPVSDERISSRAHGNKSSRGTSAENTGITMADLLAQEEKLTVEKVKMDRDMDTFDDEMRSDVIALIQLFGIPYVDSPAEAEAQCVALERLGLVDGIVTEDSDVFVFGGKNIYRNMFDDQKYVEIYRSNDAKNEMSLGKEQMVALAMLLGGDYTEGVKGVGIVNAMEIIEVFQMSPDVKKGLLEFRKWLDGFDPTDVSPLLASTHLNSTKTPLEKFHVAHKSARLRWVCPPNFPADNVLNAYLNPVVDTSTKPFTWGVPDIENLMLFCSKHIGWEPSETRRMLQPIVQKLERSSMRQTRLDTFMTYSDNIQFANVRSKRLRSVLKGVQKDASGKNT